MRSALGSFPILSAIVLSTSFASAKVFQDVQQFKRHADSKSSFDFIIVGGGTAGCVLASRLSENPAFSVLLLEAGGNNEGILDLAVPGLVDTIPAAYRWNRTTIPQPYTNNRSLDVRGGYVLGGSSSINGMVYTRGSKDDYDLWGRVSDDQKWTWAELQPWVAKHEKWTPPAGGRDATGQYDPQYHGKHGPVRTTLTWSGPNEYDERSTRNAHLHEGFKFAQDSNSGEPIGLSWTQFTFGGGERNSAATGYLRNNTRLRDNLTIVLNARVKRVLPTKPKSRGEALDIRTIEVGSLTNNITLNLTASKEVVLSAGAVGSPHILLNSGIGPKNELKSVGVHTVVDHPRVGKGLVDHLRVSVTWSTNYTSPVVDVAAALEQWRADRTGPMSEWQVIGKQILWHRFDENSTVLQEHGDPSSGPTSPHVEITLTAGGPVMRGVVVVLTPKSSGTVTLSSSDPFLEPIIDPAYFSHPFDIEAFAEAVRIARRWYTGPAWDGYILQFLGPDPDVLSPDEFADAVKDSAESIQHLVGTCAMGPKGGNPEDSVVDPQLRVRGVEGLRVVDASVIPYVPTGHTQAPVYILAERAVDLIQDAW